MEKLANQQGREVTLNEFADCTPDEYEKASRSKSTPQRDSYAQERQSQRVQQAPEPAKPSINDQPELVRTKRSVYVSREEEDENVDQAATIAEIERFAMQKAEEAAKRVEQFRQKLQQRIPGFDQKRAEVERTKRERQAARLKLEQKRREEALRAEAERLASVEAEAKREEENRRRSQWDQTGTNSRNPFPQRSQDRFGDQSGTEKEDNSYQMPQRDGRKPAFIQSGTSRPRDENETILPPEMDTEETQPIVKPPTTNGNNPFQRRPAFTSSPNDSIGSKSNEGIGTNEYSSSSWQNQDMSGSFGMNGSSASDSNFEDSNSNLDQTTDATSENDFNSEPNGSSYQMPTTHSTGLGSQSSFTSETGETPFESFNSSPSFVDTSSNAESNPDPASQKSESDFMPDYSGSYFMNVPNNSEEQAPSFDYIQNWAAANPEASDQPDETVDDASVGGNDINGSSWYGSNETPAIQKEPSADSSPFARRGPMNKGSSYLDNLSGQEKTSSGVNSYPTGSSGEQPSQQDSSSRSGTVYPERIKAAYRDWCQYYGKEYNSDRLATFSSNFLAVERYHRETGVSLILNELADMSSEEFQQNRN